MDSVANWFNTWREIASAQVDSLFAYVPNLLAAIALVVMGWLVAQLARSVVQRVGNGINGALDRGMTRGRLDRLRLSTGALQVVAAILYWIVVLFFLAEAASVAKLQTFATWLDRLVAFVPSIVSAGAIILVGYIASTLVRDVVTASMLSDAGERDVLGDTADVNVSAVFAQLVTILVAIVIGIDQLGIEVAFLFTLIYIALAGGLLSLAVAFGLGARALVSNLIGAHDLRQHYALGQTVRINAVDGEILQLTSTSVVLNTRDGRVIVPAKIFHEQNSTLMLPQE